MSKSKKLSDLGKPFFFLNLSVCLSTCLPVYLFVYPSVCQVLSPSDDSAILNIHTNLKLWKRLNIYCDLRARQLIIVYERLNDNRMDFFFLVSNLQDNNPGSTRPHTSVRCTSRVYREIKKYSGTHCRCVFQGFRDKKEKYCSRQCSREKRWQPPSQTPAPRYVWSLTPPTHPQGTKKFRGRHLPFYQYSKF